MAKIIFPLTIPLFINLIFPLSSFSQTEEETMTITTYYPAPYGVYNEMRSKKMAVGDNYYNGSQYCWSPATCTNQIDGVSSSCWPNCNTDLIVEGNVGIGTASPTSRLNIWGTAADENTYLIDFTRIDQPEIGGGIRWRDNTNTVKWEFKGVGGGSPGIYFKEGANDRVVIRNGGNVGIGTTNPAYLLDVDHPTANSNVARIKPKVGSGDIEVLTLQSGNGDPILTARNTGNVGIGTTSPNVNLDARGVVALGNTGNRFVVGQRLISGQKGVWFTVDDVASNVAGIQAENAGTGYFSMALQPFGGNVGIGTADPTQKLTVRGTLRLTDGSYNGDLTMGSNGVQINTYFAPTIDGSGGLGHASFRFGQLYSLNKNAVVDTANYGRRILVVRESPEAKFIDEGEGQLINGELKIYIGPIFKETVNTKVPYLVYLTLLDEANGLRVAERTPDYFVVREIKNGESNAKFSWQISAFRLGYENLRIPEANIDANSKINVPHPFMTMDELGYKDLKLESKSIKETKRVRPQH